MLTIDFEKVKNQDIFFRIIKKMYACKKRYITTIELLEDKMRKILEKWDKIKMSKVW